MSKMHKKEIIIGRKYEQAKLEKAYYSKRAEFIAVYGRRRVGKTFLVREFFSNKSCVYFQVTGVHKGKQSLQLNEFIKEIKKVFFPGAVKLEIPKNWMDAFEILTECLNRQNKKEKIVIFFDELPWMAMRSSKLLQAIEYYWNRYWVSIPNLKFVICGSSSSWVINNIIKNKGGLHNRVTLRLPIEPFGLAETKDFLKYEGINYDQYQTLQLYMCLGGIPFYLTMLEKDLSAIQNINKACFQKKGSLLDEFDILFSSLFSNSDIYKTLIELIASKREGITREEIERLMQCRGGRLTRWLSELEDIGFITSFTPWGREKKGLYYKLIDEYTLFYLTWIAPKSKNRVKNELTTKYWEEISQTQAWKTWAGYAFEAVCFKHISQIRRALHIPDGAEAYAWKYIPHKKSEFQSGAQIDLVFDRPDGIVNLCEIKYSKSNFTIDKKEAKKLLSKVNVYREVTKTKKLIFISLITTFSLKKSANAENLVTSFATFDDLFKIIES
jgi:uncharacterized protein